jgi:hypothetical protein
MEILTYISLMCKIIIAEQKPPGFQTVSTAPVQNEYMQKYD